MNKWGVRLVACLFFIRAISDAYILVANPGTAGDSLGWDVNFFGANLSNVMPWVAIVILVFVGIQLLRFQPSGRFWALILLWLATLLLGGFFVWMTALVAKSLYYNEPMELSHTNWYGEIRGPIPFLLFLFGGFVLYFIPTYYLMRKDVKQLFEKPVTTGEAN